MKEILVVAGVMMSDSKYHIFQRNIKKSFGGLWEFPGGKIEPGESPQKALQRELREELKIETNIGNKILSSETIISKDSIIKISFYEVAILSNDFTLTEHEDTKLIDINDFDLFKFAPADIPLINKIKEEKVT